MLNKISNIIKQYNTFAIVPHVNPDGDAIGSSMALCHAIRSLGKEAYILLAGDIPKNLDFLWNNDFRGSADTLYDVCIVLDCGDESRMCGYKQEVYDKAKVTVCMDHHVTNSGLGDYCYIDPSAAATGEIIYFLIVKYLNVELDIDMASYLYMAIVCDTGNFKYSNTSNITHVIAADLIGKGINFSSMTHTLFDTNTLCQLKAQQEAIGNLESALDGKVYITHIDYIFLEKYGMTFDEVDFLVSIPRDIEGAEVGMFLKIHSPNEIKVSLRSNEKVDVSKIASVFGGGGHVRASGFTLTVSLDTAKELVLKEIEKQL